MLYKLPGLLCSLCWLLLLSSRHVSVMAFTPVTPKVTFQGASSTLLGAKRRVLVKERPLLPEDSEDKTLPTYDPLGLASKDYRDQAGRAALTMASVAAPLTFMANDAVAASSRELLSAGDLNPANFNPVCPASDTFYRFLQSSTQAVVGDESFVEYGPLIAGGLLRIRLELCVVESFFQEAVGPFIERNGISWVLPMRETAETFLAGVVFSLASTFILVGSTKIISVIATYVDVFLGIPSRIFGGFLFDRATGKPVTLDVGFGPFKARVIGPPEEEEVAEMDANPLNLLVALVSGVVKYFGEALKVSKNSKCGPISKHGVDTHIR